jgi:hydrogenase/urease accessory protein HupE
MTKAGGGIYPAAGFFCKMSRLSLIGRLGIAWMLWLCAGGALFAHDPGLSSADVTVGAGQIHVTVTLNVRDWNYIGITTPEEVRKECLALTLNGRPLEATGSTGPTPDNIQNVGCGLTYPGVGGGKLVVRSLVLDKLPFGHREFIKIHDEVGHVLLEQMLHLDSESCEVTVAPGNPAPAGPPAFGAFIDFLLLGVRHILTGYDHMLFLAGLLMVCSSFRQAAGVITYFTVAHSITLALSALNVISLPSRIVEPAVALSIAYVGFENIMRPQDLKWRGPIAFGFGLVHGLGFASILRTMGIGSGHTGILVPLISFNLGVELGQLAVALTVLPIIFLLRDRPAFFRFGSPAASMGIALLGVLWFLQRTVLT